MPSVLPEGSSSSPSRWKISAPLIQETYPGWGYMLAQGEGVKFLRMGENAAVYAMGSGTYLFQSTLKETSK